MRERQQSYRQEEIPPPEASNHLTYNPDFDSHRYAALHSLRSSDPSEYSLRRRQLDGEIFVNLQTTLGERFHTSLSARRDRIIDGKLYSEFNDEPLTDVFQRGRDYRFMHSSSHDRIREAAEVEGFLKIESAMGNPETLPGSMIVLLSPPGGESSIYQHNFYDVFTLREENGERFVESVRYSSALTIGDYVSVASSFSPGYFSEKETTDVPYDAYFLSRPLHLSPEHATFSSAEELHAYLHRDHDVLSPDEMDIITDACTPLILAYIAMVAEDPESVYERNRYLNAILNKADNIYDELSRADHWGTLYQRPTETTLQDEIEYWGGLSVREVMTGCGFSGGFATGSEAGSFGGSIVDASAVSPFSVMEFGFSSDRYGSRTFKCPHCNFENKRPYNQLIKYCQKDTCRKDVSC